MAAQQYKVARNGLLLAFAAGLIAAVTFGLDLWPRAVAAPADDEALPVRPRVAAASDIDAGRYLVTIAGCNDCHTPGFDKTGGNVAEEQWLLGTDIAWRGPWGSTYASNLRLHVQEFDDAATWIMVMRARKDRPPMPWASIHAMSDEDLGSIFQFIRSLGAAGEKMPEYVPPDQEPRTAYRMLTPTMPQAAQSQ